ncbi:MAG TPA: FecR domain-containing protein [Usitatibacter sp.]|nr:FecR domain-containing protein [Usitatibacter sp.]
MATAFALAWLAATGCALAQTVTVEAVQYPAWLERGGRAVPLSPGTVLQGQDRLRTGGNARVQLRLSEGSAVKLGENAQFVIERAEDRGVYRAAFAVLTGAFRFTTEALGKVRGRDISIKVKNVTAGIRGTDVWGKSTEERDLVCLIEGRVSVAAAGHPATTLEQPLDFYQKPRDGEPQVAKIDARQLEIWSKETEIDPKGAAARVGGEWRVFAARSAERDSARAMQRRLRAAGYPADIVEAEGFFNVQVPNLASEDQARALMAGLRTIPGVTLPKVLPMR